MGEFRLRGIRYLILDKRILRPNQWQIWCRARTHDGRPWGQVVHEDESSRVVDLEATPAEACLVVDWASASAKAGEVCRGTTNAGAGCVPPHGAVTFEPCMPLRPGRYQATFDLQADSTAEGLCEITRLFFDPRRDLELDWERPSVTLVSAPLRGQDRDHPVRLEFTVPEEAGLEPVLQFRVVHAGGGSLRVRRVLISPME
jgi:hypothetical protein